MSTTAYRSIVVVSALAWFMFGLHAPMLHQITHHHRMPDTTVLVAIAITAVLGVICTFALLRAPRLGDGTGLDE